MNNSSTKTGADNFERISEDLVELLIAIGSLSDPDEKDRQVAKLLLSTAAASICKRAIVLTA